MPRTLLRTAFPFVAAAMTSLFGVLPARDAAASSPFLVIPEPEVAEQSSAYRYANMSGAEAIAELDRRKVPYKVADPIAGVVSPVRLTGKLHGVYIHSSIPESQRATSIYEVLDARLALALDDFAKILERHDIEEVVHYSLYRPNVPRHNHDVKEEKTPVKKSKPESKHASVKGDSASRKAETAEPKRASHPEPKAAAKPGAAPKQVFSAKPAAKALPSPAQKGHAKVAGVKQKAPKSSKESPAPPKTKAPSKASPAPAKASPAPAKASPAPAKASPAQPKTPSAQSKAAHAKGSVKTAAKKGASRTRKVAQKAGKSVRARAGAKPSVKSHAKPAAASKTVEKAAAGAQATKSHASSAETVRTTEKASVSATTSPKAPVSRQKWAPPGTRHPAGLAIDVALLKKRDGGWVSVASHFHGKIGNKTCGDGVASGVTPEARELRSIVCEAYDLGVFTYVLTPNYNAAHFDHFHMEVRPTVKWFLYQ